jgi:NAD(P)-dependent dehydrogenase (short-subunit alcohol dehydrogenase family)
MSTEKKKVWFITGASRGFGLEVARAALLRGDEVIATARRPEGLSALLGAHDGLLCLPLDVTDESQAIAAAAAGVERFGRIDVLLNNAGYGLLGAVEDASAAEIERQFQTNVFGLMKVTRAVLPHMRCACAGHVINLSSIGGFSSFPGWGIYCASKFAVEGLTEALAAEVAPLGIHVTAVQPGLFRTDFLDDSSMVRTAQASDAYAGTAGAMLALMASANHQQPGDPKKLAQALLRLADSPEPPVWLPLGSDSVAKVGERHRAVEQALAQWRDVAVSTDHDGAVPRSLDD